MTDTLLPAQPLLSNLLPFFRLLLTFDGYWSFEGKVVWCPFGFARLTYSLLDSLFFQTMLFNFAHGLHRRVLKVAPVMHAMLGYRLAELADSVLVIVLDFFLTYEAQLVLFLLTEEVIRLLPGTFLGPYDAKFLLDLVHWQFHIFDLLRLLVLDFDEFVQDGFVLAGVVVENFARPKRHVFRFLLRASRNVTQLVQQWLLVSLEGLRFYDVFRFCGFLMIFGEIAVNTFLPLKLSPRANRNA